VQPWLVAGVTIPSFWRRFGRLSRFL